MAPDSLIDLRTGGHMFVTLALVYVFVAAMRHASAGLRADDAESAFWRRVSSWRDVFQSADGCAALQTRQGLRETERVALKTDLGANACTVRQIQRPRHSRTT